MQEDQLNVMCFNCRVTIVLSSQYQQCPLPYVKQRMIHMQTHLA